MNYVLYVAIAALLVGQVLMWVALFHLWRAGDSQQRVIHSLRTSVESQTQVNVALNEQLAMLNKALRRFAADQTMTARAVR